MTRAPITFHVAGSLLRDRWRLGQFYGPLADGLRARGGDVRLVMHERDKAAAQNLVDTVMKKWGRIDSLVCNAASNPHFGPLMPFMGRKMACGPYRIPAVDVGWVAYATTQEQESL
mgnify:CR=1 FL=1